MRTCSAKAPSLALAIFFLFFSAVSAHAVDTSFELEPFATANAVGGDGAGDDWDTALGVTGIPAANQRTNTGVQVDAPGTSIFTGGRKDIQDIPEWGHKSGAVPDKDDITNAYAAAYDVEGDLVIYFGADRFANAGDAFLGFWFFKAAVAALPNGSFSGVHTLGDLLVLVIFPQANNAVPEISVASWDPACSRAANNNPQVGECAAANLRLLLDQEGMAGAGAAVCLAAGGTQDACATTNSTSVPAPWLYTPKTGPAGSFPFESFFEGGVNITKLLNGNEGCFSSFMAESRSSSSFTASLKDFSLGSFNLCGMKITKECTDSRVNDTEDGFVHTFSGEVTNTGFGTIFDVMVHDETSNQTFDLGNIDAGESAPYDGTFESTQNPPTNTVTATASSSSGGPEDINAGPVDALCPAVDLDPMISVTKECTPVLDFDEVPGNVIVRVDYEGMVCNDTDAGPLGVTLNDVAVTDDGGTPGNMSDDQTFDIGTLAPEECSPYGPSSYFPATANSTDPGQASFSDTVTAEGNSSLFGKAMDSATATCELCPSMP